MKRVVAILFVFILLFISSGCSKTGLEVGKWHGVVDLDSLDLSDDDRLIITLLAGSVAYEIDAEFRDDNTYSYVMNMEQFRDGIKQSASTIIGVFLGFDLDVFVDRIFDLVFDEMDMTEYSSYGTYSVDDNGIITAVGSEALYFRVSSGVLEQLGDSGQVIMSFDRVE